MIGAGNLATHLSLALSRLSDVEIVQVYSRTKAHAEELARQLSCPPTDDSTAVRTDADLYIFSLKDTALEQVIAAIPQNEGLWIHTAGSMPMEIFNGYTTRYGVLYPLQTFSKQREVDFSVIPLFIEWKREEDRALLEGLAHRLSNRVQMLSSEARRSLHLAAVFACNFTNHMYVLAGELLEKSHIQADVLLPLIDETAAKVHDLPAIQAQTGPAVRYDENVIQKHLAQLSDDPNLQSVYQLLSHSIHQYAKR